MEKIISIDYYSQKNNEIDPNIACQVTTATELLDYCKVDFSIMPFTNKFRQPEDRLRYFTSNDKRVIDYCNRSHPLSKIHPAEWLDVMSYSIDLIFHNVLTYYIDWSPERLKKEIDNNKPVTMSTWLYGGHYVVVKGYEEKHGIIFWIVDDPYKGKDLRMMNADFKWWGLRIL